MTTIRRTPGDRVRRAVLADAAHGFLPLDLLDATGRTQAAVAAWAGGHLAEVPCGAVFDVVRLPADLAAPTVEQLRDDRIQVGPVLLGPLGAEFLVVPGTAHQPVGGTWSVARPGTLVLMPHPSITKGVRVGGRTWLVPPGSNPLTPGVELRRAYITAAEAAAKAAARAAALARAVV
ncbi:hypothetical protein [Streptomyces megasporus]|uniref:hypothetical protein n=1 Tax=Streptomyces megasporus TaxID=44060 RepID=UPI00068E933C|nr:hypothetical protein [Streptomyces megasporus]